MIIVIIITITIILIIINLYSDRYIKREKNTKKAVLFFWEKPSFDQQNLKIFSSTHADWLESRRRFLVMVAKYLQFFHFASF